MPNQLIRMVTNKLVFATNNEHKLHEVNHLLGNRYILVSLGSIGFHDEIPEDYFTLEENALQKARYIYDRYRLSCFADDTGLEVEALRGAPGVFSAMYAGEDKNPSRNVSKLLGELQGTANRNARFKTVIALVLDGKEYLFEGIAEGTIAHEPIGDAGFGYDPIFLPTGYSQTFAQMELSLKNTISHRGRAIERLASFLLSSSSL